MANLGWISLHRSMLEWEWYEDINVCRLFTHCLLKANHKDAKWKGTDIKKGSFITGVNSLSSETGLSVQQIRTALKKLKSTNEITIKSTSKSSLISITKWDSYQGDNKQNNKPITNHQQTNNKPITNEQLQTIITNNNNNEDNGNKELKEVRSESLAFLPDDIMGLFNNSFSDLPKVIKLNEQRKSRIKKLGKQDLPTIASWKEFFLIIDRSDFLMGRTKNNFKCSFDWILNPTNALKIAEGNYKNNHGANHEPEFNSDEYWQAIAEG